MNVHVLLHLLIMTDDTVTRSGWEVKIHWMDWKSLSLKEPFWTGMCHMAACIPYVHVSYLCFWKLPSLFDAWLFWTIHNKSHNMKALVILSHSWSPFLPLTCLYRKNMNLCGSPPDYYSNILYIGVHIEIQ